jgi:hypothetical protein
VYFLPLDRSLQSRWHCCGIAANDEACSAWSQKNSVCTFGPAVSQIACLITVVRKLQQHSKFILTKGGNETEMDTVKLASLLQKVDDLPVGSILMTDNI